jgi:hypothetical protein
MNVPFKTVKAECKAKGYVAEYAFGCNSYVIRSTDYWTSKTFNNTFDALIFARELPNLKTC